MFERIFWGFYRRLGWLLLCFPSHRSREDEELNKLLKAVAMGSRTGGVILETRSSVQGMSSWQQSS